LGENGLPTEEMALSSQKADNVEKIFLSLSGEFV